MIATLKGILRSKTPTEILVEVNGIGYAVNIPLSTFEKLGDVNQQVSLFTFLHVREDALQLFGFATEDERSLFKLLISISGIGPKIAQGILSGVSAAELRGFIISGNISALNALPNIGRKTAERLVVELKDKLAKGDGLTSFPISVSTQHAQIQNDALQALTSLGFTRTMAEKALRQVFIESGESAASLEDLIKKALRKISSK